MNNYIKGILGNSALLFVSRIFSKVATIVIVVLIARVLNPDLFGRYSSIVALTMIAGLVADFGLVIPTVRTASCSFGQENNIISAAFSARVFWSGVALIVFMLIGWYLNYPRLATLLFTLVAILEVGMTGLIRTLEARQDMKTITIFSLTERVVYSLIVAISLWLFRSVDGIAWGAALSYLVMLVGAVVLIRKKYGKIRLSLSVADIWRHTRTGFPFFLIAIASALYYKVDTLILTAQRPAADVGIYNAALRVVEAQVFVPVVVMASVFPTMSRLYQEKHPDFFPFVRHSILIFVAFGVTVGALLFGFAPLIIHVLFSSAYFEAIPALRVLSVMTTFYFIYFALGYVLMSMHQERTFTMVMISVATLNISANAFVIPRYGYLGASILRASTEFVLTSLLFIMVILALKNARESFSKVSFPGQEIAGSYDISIAPSDSR